MTMTVSLTIGQMIRWGVTLAAAVYHIFRKPNGSYDFGLDLLLVQMVVLAMWAGYWLGRLG